jgi:hypothetical protein
LLRAEVAELKPVKAIIGSKSLRSRGRGRAYLTALVHFNNLASNQFDHTIETILPLLVDGSAMIITRKLNAEWSKEYHG